MPVAAQRLCFAPVPELFRNGSGRKRLSPMIKSKSISTEFNELLFSRPAQALAWSVLNVGRRVAGPEGGQGGRRTPKARDGRDVTEAA